MKDKSIKEFAEWLGLEPGKKYVIKDENKIFTISKYYNGYYLGSGIGFSLSSLTLYQLLNIIEINN